MAVSKKNKFLFVLTSHDRLGDTGEKTGFHYSEMADPYYVLQEFGVEVDLASIKGGEPPVDPGSLEKPPAAVKKFMKDESAQKKLRNTMKIEDVDPSHYVGIFLPGGHGTMWDFPDNAALRKVIETIWAQGKIVAGVCHGPAAFVHALNKDGEPIVNNRQVNCFTNEEERQSKKDKVVPFLLESALREKGGLFSSADPFKAMVLQDSQLITGQNPESAIPLAQAILRSLGIDYHIQKAI